MKMKIDEEDDWATPPTSDNTERCKQHDNCNGECGPWCSAYTKEATVRELFELQRQLQKTMFNFITPVDSVENFKYSVLALIGELGEVLEADKRWKNIRNYKYDREAKLDELVDCMAFMVNMILFSGFSVEEFMFAFRRKNDKNFNRFFEELERKAMEEEK